MVSQETRKRLPDPETRGRKGARRARSLASLADWPIRSKLLVVLIVPLVAFLILGSVSSWASLRNARALGTGVKLAELTRQAAAVSHALQAERDTSVGYLALVGGGAGNTPRASELGTRLIAERTASDQAIRDYRDAVAPLRSSFGRDTTAGFNTAGDALDQLDKLRARVTAGTTGRDDAYGRYSTAIASVLMIERQVAPTSIDGQLAAGARALGDLTRVIELNSQLRGLLLAWSYQGTMSAADRDTYATLRAQRTAALSLFKDDAQGAQLIQYQELMQGPAVQAGNRLEQLAVEHQADRLPIDPDNWWLASTQQLTLLHTVESGLLDVVVNRAKTLQGAAARSAELTVGLALLTLLVSGGASLAVARSMVRELDRIKRAAGEIAEHYLPGVIDRLLSGDTTALNTTPARLAIGSRDEIGQLSASFDAIVATAVRLAVGQASQRQQIAAMLTALARRSQTLVDRQLAMISDAERDQLDPDVLHCLFGIDHLTTRLRRYNRNLMILSGVAPQDYEVTRSVDLGLLLHGAVSEVEEYQRIYVTSDELTIVGFAAPALTSLIGELLDNALRFSPPLTGVAVHGRRRAGGALIEIVDQGIGLEPNQLAAFNEQLRGEPDRELINPDRMGLQVVARLARRHGIGVWLRSDGTGGSTATVWLPPELIEQSAGAAEPAGPIPIERAPTEPLPNPPRYTPIEHAPTEPILVGPAPGSAPAEPGQRPERLADRPAARPRAQEEGVEEAMVARPADGPPAPDPDAPRWTASGLPVRVPKAKLDEIGPPAEQPEPTEELTPEPPARSSTPEDVSEALTDFWWGLDRASKEM